MEHAENYWQRATRRRLTRRQLLRGGVVIGAGLATGLPVLGCGSGQSQQAAPAKAGETPQVQAGQPKYGGILKVGYVAGSGYLSPGAAKSGFDPNWEFVLGDGFVYTADDGSPEPESSLAASWKQEDPTTFVFTLRQGIKFHDGTDYDAAAQKYNFEYLADPNRSKGFTYRTLIEAIKTMEVVDKYTLRVGLSRPDPAMLANLGGYPGIPMSPTAIEKLGPDFITKPACTGPFAVKSFTPGGDWVLEKNPNYWRKGLPYLDGITFTEIPDDRVRGASIQSGNVDLAFFPTAGEVTMKLKQDPNLVVTECPSGPTMLVLNHAMPPLDNLKIRQAVAHCVDREAILKTVFSGLGKVANGGLTPPGSWAFTDVSDVSYAFDINKAKDLIKESGVKTPIALKLICADTPADRKPQAELMKGWLGDAGFEVTLDVFAEAEVTRRGYDEMAYHLIINGLPSKADPDGVFPNYATRSGAWNAGRKSQDPVQIQLEELTKKGSSTYDQKERKKAYDELQRLQEQSVMGQIPLVYRVSTEAHRKNVKGAEKLWNTVTSTMRPRFLWKE